LIEIESEENLSFNETAFDPTLIEIFSTPLQSTFNPPLILILSSIILLILGCLLVIILTVCRLNKYRRRGYNAALTTDVEIDLDKLPSNFAYHSTTVKLNPKLEALEYPRNDVIYVRDIGAGAFGRVFMVRNSDFTLT
jgi:receptor tyrosine kinase